VIKIFTVWTNYIRCDQRFEGVIKNLTVWSKLRWCDQDIVGASNLECYCYVYVFAELFTCAKCPQQYSIIDNQANEAVTDISTLGTLVAVQLILTAHLQNTYENPFLGILTLLFGTRAFLKFMNFTLNHTASCRNTANDWIVGAKLFFFNVDTGTLTCIFELDLRISARTEMEYASTATGMLCIIVLGGTFLHTVIQSWKHWSAY